MQCISCSSNSPFALVAIGQCLSLAYTIQLPGIQLHLVRIRKLDLIEKGLVVLSMSLTEVPVDTVVASRPHREHLTVEA